MSRQLLAILLLVGIAVPYRLNAVDGQRSPDSQPDRASQSDWHREFDDLCSKTQDSMTLSEDELSTLIHRCDALLPHIEQMDESTKKVYGGRLRMCRNLYAYVLGKKKEAMNHEKETEQK